MSRSLLFYLVNSIKYIYVMSIMVCYCLFWFLFYLDLQFPIDLSNVAKDHPFLENDPLQSLYRRLVALNRCATMRLDSAHKHGTNVSINIAIFSRKEPYWCEPKKRVIWIRSHWKSIDFDTNFIAEYMNQLNDFLITQK